MKNDWCENAKCLGNDTEFFFQTGYGYQLAEEFCETCPVRTECLNSALLEEQGKQLFSRHGVRGGMNAKDRYNLSVDLGLVDGKKQGNPRLEHRPCVICGAIFRPFTVRGKCCSKACQYVRDLERQKEARRIRRLEREKQVAA